MCLCDKYLHAYVLYLHKYHTHICMYICVYVHTHIVSCVGAGVCVEACTHMCVCNFRCLLQSFITIIFYDWLSIWI